VEQPRLLTEPLLADTPVPADLPALTVENPPREPVPIADNGEPLERLNDTIHALPVYALQGWPGASDTLVVRKSVNGLLLAAQEALPPGFGLVVLDGWRSMPLQRALYNHYYSRARKGGLQPGFVADPNDPENPPPHSTGGAVDITLSWAGIPLRLGTDFDAFTPEAHLDALEDDPGREPDRSLRRLLAHTLMEVGLAPYFQEWWHFSYGDQLWAQSAHQATAVYGQVPRNGQPYRRG
jgi:D-alanyl-D-alanine dipeptidase